MTGFKNEIDTLLNKFKSLGLTFKDAYLAGGAITSTFTGKTVRDYDFYFKNKEAFIDAVIGMYEDAYWCVAVTPRAITFVNNNNGGEVIQLMCFDWFPTPEDIFKKFDFTCCMAALELDAYGLLSKHEDFVRDLTARNLRFNHGTDFPLGSAMRVKKYNEKGFKIVDTEYLKIILACSFKEIKNWEELKNQIGGQYGEAVSLDISKEFNIENAINSLDTAILQAPNSLFKKAENAKEALIMIFGEEEFGNICNSNPENKEYFDSLLPVYGKLPGWNSVLG